MTYISSVSRGWLAQRKTVRLLIQRSEFDSPKPQNPKTPICKLNNILKINTFIIIPKLELFSTKYMFYHYLRMRWYMTQNQTFHRTLFLWHVLNGRCIFCTIDHFEELGICRDIKLKNHLLLLQEFYLGCCQHC